MAAGDLCTLPKLKTFLGIPSGSTADDALLGDLITAVSDWIVQEIGAPLLADDYDSRFNGTGGWTLVLPQVPVTLVQLVTVDGATLPRAPTDIAAGWVHDDVAVYLRGYRFTKGVQNVRVVRTAGFDADTLPPMIAQTCIDLCALVYKSKDRIDVQSKTLAGEVITYMQRAMPDRAIRTLQGLRRIVPA
jgi:hypothetical protein